VDDKTNPEEPVTRDLDPNRAITETFGPVVEHIDRNASTLGPTPRQILEALADVNEVARRLNDDDLPAALVLRVVNEHRSDNMRIHALDHPNCPPRAFEVAARNPNHEVRHAVATNRRTPPHTLGQLMRDDTMSVLMAAAANPSTTPSARAMLTTHPDPAVRRYAAGGPLTDHAVARLITDHEISVRAAVASRRSLSPVEVARLCEDPSPEVRFHLAQTLADDPMTDRRALERLARDPDIEVRSLVTAAIEARHQ
jgi:hypothetical protein